MSVPPAQPRASAPTALTPGPVPLGVTTLPIAAQALNAMALGPDGMVYAVNANGISRVEADGRLTLAFPAQQDLNAASAVDHLTYPIAATFGADGTLYASGLNDRIYRVSPDGKVVSFPAPGYDWLLSPALAVDRQGNLYYMANTINRAQRDTVPDCYLARLAPDGTHSVFAGAPGTGAGYADGVAAAARFNISTALAFDADGNLFVADTGNLSIRRVTPAGVVSTVAGHGAPQLPPSPMPGMPSPDLAPLYEGTVPVWGLAVSPDGTLFYSASDNRIHRVGVDGVESVYAGDGRTCLPLTACADVCAPQPAPDACWRDAGVPLEAEFNFPGAVLAAPGGTVYVLDGYQGRGVRRLRRIAGQAGPPHAGPLAVTRSLPSPAVSPPVPSPLPVRQLPLASCPPGRTCSLPGKVYDQDGQLVTAPLEVWMEVNGHPETARKVGDAVGGAFEVPAPGGAAEGIVVTVLGAGYGKRHRLLPPTRGYFDEQQGGTALNFGGPATSLDPDAPAFYLPAAGGDAGSIPARVQFKFEATHVTTLAKDPGGDFLWATGGLALLPDGRILTTNRNSNSILLVGADGKPSLLAGGPYPMPYMHEQYLLDGKGTEAHFYEPGDVVLDPAGNAYVADRGNSAVRKVAPDGTVTTLAGIRPYGYRDGPGNQALFWGVGALALDRQGNVFVADTSNNCIRKITPEGNVSTLAGAQASGFADGAGATARFRGPTDLAMGPDDVLYVADQGNHRIRRITPAGEVSTAYGDPVLDTAGNARLPDLDDLRTIAADAAGTLYAATSSRVYKLGKDGEVTVLAGYGLYGNGDGPSAQAYFSDISALLPGAGGVMYVADASNGAIRKITPD